MSMETAATEASKPDRYQPWIAIGVSKSTYYRRVVRERVAAERAAGFNRICAAIVAELGGEAAIGEVRMTLVRRYASMSSVAAELEGRMIQGLEIDRKELITVTSLISRLAAQLNILAKPKDEMPTLAEYLSQKAATAEPDHGVEVDAVAELDEVDTEEQQS